MDRNPEERCDGVFTAMDSMDQPTPATAPNPPSPEAVEPDDNKALKALRAERDARKRAERDLKATRKDFDTRLAAAVEEATKEAAKALKSQQRKHANELKRQENALEESRVNAEVSRQARRAGLVDSPEAETYLISQLQSHKLAVAPDEISGRDDVIFDASGKAVLDDQGNELDLGGWLETQRTDAAWESHLRAPQGQIPSAPQATANHRSARSRH